jgi:hypothetical protein
VSAKNYRLIVRKRGAAQTKHFGAAQNTNIDNKNIDASATMMDFSNNDDDSSYDEEAPVPVTTAKKVHPLEGG